jgi:hypothetical protein
MISVSRPRPCGGNGAAFCAPATQSIWRRAGAIDRNSICVAPHLKIEVPRPSHQPRGIRYGIRAWESGPIPGFLLCRQTLYTFPITITPSTMDIAPTCLRNAPPLPRARFLEAKTERRAGGRHRTCPLRLRSGRRCCGSRLPRYRRRPCSEPRPHPAAVNTCRWRCWKPVTATWSAPSPLALGSACFECPPAPSSRAPPVLPRTGVVRCHNSQMGRRSSADPLHRLANDVERVVLTRRHDEANSPAHRQPSVRDPSHQGRAQPRQALP